MQQPAQQQMTVTCPASSAPGDTISVQGPSGQMLSVVVPAGVAPGGQFVAAIAAPAVPVAHGVAVPMGAPRPYGSAPTPYIVNATPV